MQRIIVNGRFFLHRVTGVERYARELLEALDEIVNTGEIELAIPADVRITPDYERIKVSKIGKLKNRLWEHVSFPRYVKKRKGISLNLCNVAPLSSPDIAGVMDVKIKATPQFFSKRFLYWYRFLFTNEIYRSKRIITISEFSKMEIMKYYHIEENKIVVIPCAWQHFTGIDYDDGAFEKYGVEKGNYYFSMCSLEPNKNFRWIAENAKNNPELSFVIAGSINKKVFSEGLGFECPQNMKLIGYVSDEEAKSLMKECKGFLFPTFYEGFGMPPLEALSAGAKCIVVSDIPVMHEIFDKCANYVDPNRYDANFSRFKDISQDDKYAILNKYSWKESAKILYNLLSCV